MTTMLLATRGPSLGVSSISRVTYTDRGEERERINFIRLLGVTFGSEESHCSPPLLSFQNSNTCGQHVLLDLQHVHHAGRLPETGKVPPDRDRNGTHYYVICGFVQRFGGRQKGHLQLAWWTPTPREHYCLSLCWAGDLIESQFYYSRTWNFRKLQRYFISTVVQGAGQIHLIGLPLPNVHSSSSRGRVIGHSRRPFEG